jgi:hypothetical protein
MLKDKQSLYGTNIMELTRDGRSSMLIQLSLRPRDSMKNSDSTSTDHSILSPNSHSTELLRCTVTLMYGSRDGEIMLHNNSGGSMRRQRLLEITMDHGRAMLWKSKVTVDLTTSEPLVSTLDGGKCGESMVNTSETRKVKLSQLTDHSTMKTETLLLRTRMERQAKSGMSSMLMNMRRSQLRVNSTRSSDFTLRETSTLSQHCQEAECSTCLITETWSSRLETEESNKSGTSTNNL